MAVDFSREIRVLVIDDSPVGRRVLKTMLESDPAIRVIDVARDGKEGVEKVLELKPDLATLDVEMPRMDGLEALREIMAQHPIPVMMVSSLTADGAQATLAALELGAVDFIAKPDLGISPDRDAIRDELLAKVKDIAGRRHILMSRYQAGKLSRKHASNEIQSTGGPSKLVTRNRRVAVVSVGASTGGPPALREVIPKLPASFPVGVVIAQHMPPAFTRSLADRLDSLSELSVKEAEDGEKLEPGVVLVAPGGRQLTVKRVAGRVRVHISDNPADSLYKPCVDITMRSVAGTYGGTAMGVVLSGMGTNGAQGFKELKSKGGVVIAQDEASCVVYGMPRAVIEADLADHILPIDQIATEIVSYF
jgi:two-component system chemotaxis response regulator CheB